MLKKIYRELIAIRKELQAIGSHLEFIKEHPFNVVTDFPLPLSPLLDAKAKNKETVSAVSVVSHAKGSESH